ncbi:hypothetical protein CC86DRAFT_413998 [Ophiobolus disseminans]|uniref:Uncharacterized protein n=1 Tax=Ophiobolus disseminans TaxID=1469910 RepID=A0A6A6ZDI1_9PLEO|nr:hypothetical protein CC86DRAFT_413998 [Ophiobolus disseminans]
MDVDKVLQAEDCKYEQSIIQEYLKRVRDVTWNKVFLQGVQPPASTGGSTSETLIGLGPPKTQEGDVIAILYGCSVPVILRPMRDASSPQGYDFIGEAYIYGKMDGEAMFQSYLEMDFILL